MGAASRRRPAREELVLGGLNESIARRISAAAAAAGIGAAGRPWPVRRTLDAGGPDGFGEGGRAIDCGAGVRLSISAADP